MRGTANIWVVLEFILIKNQFMLLAYTLSQCLVNFLQGQAQCSQWTQASKVFLKKTKFLLNHNLASIYVLILTITLPDFLVLLSSFSNILISFLSRSFDYSGRMDNKRIIKLQDNKKKIWKLFLRTGSKRFYIAQFYRPSC